MPSITPVPDPPAPQKGPVGRLFRGIDRYLSLLPPEVVERGGVALILGIGVLGYALGPEPLVAPLHIIPILAAVWYGARRAGYFLCLLATGVWLSAYLLSQEPLPLPGTILWNAGAQLAVFFTVAFFATRLRASLGNERLLALSDPLTGLANSRAFFEGLRHEVDRALRYGTVFTLVYLDLDHFKEVNDTLGHAEGNRVLHLVSDMLKKSMRSTDLVARLGGDEFGILLTETPYQKAAGALEKLQTQILSAMEERGWPVTISFGAVTFETPTATADDAIRVADSLMYQAKEAGGDGIHHILWTGEDAVDSSP